MRTAAALAAIVLVIPPAFAGSFRWGARAGAPLTDYFETGRTGSLHGGAEYSSATRRYTVGPSFEWWATRSLGFEVDALYHRMGYVGTVQTFWNGAFTKSSIDVKGGSWDFPLLVKHSFRGKVRPYAAGGVVLRYMWPVRGRGELTASDLVAQTSVTTPIDTTDPSELRKRFYPGIAVGAGVEFKAGRLHLLPEVRFTHWTANISDSSGVLRFAPNQVEILLGTLF